MDHICKATIDAQNAVVALVVQVMSLGTAPESAELGKAIEQLLKLPEFQKALEKHMMGYAKAYLNSNLSSPPKQSNPSGKSSSPSTASTNKKQKLEDNPVVKAATEGVKAVGLKFVSTCTAPGIFYNKNSRQIIIVGSIMAVAGVFAVWKSRSDVASNLFEGKSFDHNFKAKSIGTLNISAKAIEFRPSEQKTETAVSVKLNRNWSQFISTDLGLQGTIKTQKAEFKPSLSNASVGLRMRLSDAMTLSGGGAYSFADKSKDMYLNFDYRKDNLQIGLEYRQSQQNRPEYKQDHIFLIKVQADL